MNRLFPARGTAESAVSLGFRFGSKGAHTSRTMMFEELSGVLEAVPAMAERADYAEAIIGANCLFKATTATRRLTNQRLGELYGLTRSVPLFRVLRRLWDFDETGRPLIALQCAIARDPLLASTCPAVIDLPPGAELQREQMKSALRGAVGDRLNGSTFDKVLRNAASSWTQTGHLEGRTFKKRRVVRSTPAAAAYAIYLAHALGFRGNDIFYSGWLRLLDCDPSQARHLALEAKRLGLIDLRMAGDVVELNVARLDPASGRI